MIKPLTSLRFFFALMVFIHHTYLLNISADKVFFHFLNRNIFAEGYIGVSFFFILSGFILSFNYKNKLLLKKITFKEFWVARISRIFPLHLFTLLLTVPLFLNDFVTQTITSVGKLLINMLLLQSFFPLSEIYNSFNFVSWSISDEMFFYLMFPIIIAFYFKHKKAVNLPLVLVLTLLIPLGILLAPHYLEHRFFYVNPLFRIIDFNIGILLYYVYEYKIFDKLLKSIKLATLLEISSVILLILFFIFHRHIPQGYRYSCYYWLPMIIIILVFAHKSGYISVLLSNKTIVSLGEVSFGFYLIHVLAFRYISHLNRKFSLITNDYLLIAVIFIAVLIASYMSYFYLELPSNKYIKSKYRLITATKLRLV
jgi:peptidoglycan/LPS O-acetylase OafA/YrhL